MVCGLDDGKDYGDGARQGWRCGKGKGLTVVVGISTEKVAEDLSVAGCVAGPHVPDLVT